MEQEKQVIYFSDLFFAVLKRWKALVVVTLVLALALGAFQYWKNSKLDPDSADRTDASIAYNQEQVNTISQNIFNQQKYMSESVLMTMDPYNLGKVTVDVYVYTDYQIMPGMEYQNTDKTLAVMRSYATQLQSQEALEAYSAATNISVGYVAELITYEYVANSNVLSIVIHCPNMETAQKLADAVVAQVEGAKESVAARITTHELSVIATPSTSPVDLDVAKAQSDAADRLTKLRTSLSGTQTELANVQNYAADSQATSPFFMAALGAFLGMFLVVCWAVVCHLGSNKIYSGRVLENRVDVRILGALPSKAKAPIAHKLEGRAVTPLYDVLAMNIRNYCDQEQEILLLGDISDVHKDALTGALKELNITATFDGSLLSSASALKQLRDSSAVVLLYTCGLSFYSQAEKEVAMVNDQNKNLLGCILIDG